MQHPLEGDQQLLLRSMSVLDCSSTSVRSGCCLLAACLLIPCCASAACTAACCVQLCNLERCSHSSVCLVRHLGGGPCPRPCGACALQEIVVQLQAGLAASPHSPHALERVTQLVQVSLHDTCMGLSMRICTDPLWAHHLWKLRHLFEVEP